MPPILLIGYLLPFIYLEQSDIPIEWTLLLCPLSLPPHLEHPPQKKNHRRSTTSSIIAIFWTRATMDLVLLGQIKRLQPCHALDRVPYNPLWKTLFEETNVLHLPKTSFDHPPSSLTTPLPLTHSIKYPTAKEIIAWIFRQREFIKLFCCVSLQSPFFYFIPAFS